MNSIMSPAQRRLRQHVRLRREQVADIVRRWRAEVPSAFRLGFDLQVRWPEVEITERRISASTFRNPDHWGEDYREPGLSVVEVYLIADKRRTMLDYRTLAGISLHALARWFQRSRATKEALLIEDIRALCDCVVSLRETEQDFVASSENGCWCGHLVEVIHPKSGQRQRLIAARTWLSSEMIRDDAA